VAVGQTVGSLTWPHLQHRGQPKSAKREGHLLGILESTLAESCLQLGKPIASWGRGAGVTGEEARCKQNGQEGRHRLNKPKLQSRYPRVKNLKTVSRAMHPGGRVNYSHERDVFTSHTY
jgi:hypothetical protein